MAETGPWPPRLSHSPCLSVGHRNTVACWLWRTKPPRSPDLLDVPLASAVCDRAGSEPAPASSAGRPPARLRANARSPPVRVKRFRLRLPRLGGSFLRCLLKGFESVRYRWGSQVNVSRTGDGSSRRCQPESEPEPRGRPPARPAPARSTSAARGTRAAPRASARQTFALRGT